MKGRKSTFKLYDLRPFITGRLNYWHQQLFMMTSINVCIQNETQVTFNLLLSTILSKQKAKKIMFNTQYIKENMPWWLIGSVFEICCVLLW